MVGVRRCPLVGQPGELGWGRAWIALEVATCVEMLAGMEPMDELLRASGQYGPRVEVPDDADPRTRLIGFIGRDPAWRAP